MKLTEIILAWAYLFFKRDFNADEVLSIMDGFEKDAVAIPDGVPREKTGKMDISVLNKIHSTWV